MCVINVQLILLCELPSHLLINVETFIELLKRYIVEFKLLPN